MGILWRIYPALGKNFQSAHWCDKSGNFWVVTIHRSVDWEICKRAAFNFKHLIILVSSFIIDTRQICPCLHSLLYMYLLTFLQLGWRKLSWGDFFLIWQGMLSLLEMLPIGNYPSPLPPLLYYHQSEEIVILAIKLIKQINNGRDDFLQ